MTIQKVSRIVLISKGKMGILSNGFLRDACIFITFMVIFCRIIHIGSILVLFG